MKKERGHTRSSTTRTLSAETSLDAEIALRKTPRKCEASDGASVIRPQALRRPLGRARSALALRVYRNTAAFRGMAH